jgi:hypothetical protein
MTGDKSVKLVFIQNSDVTFSFVFLDLMSIIPLFSNDQRVINNIICAIYKFKLIVYFNMVA